MSKDWALTSFVAGLATVQKTKVWHLSVTHLKSCDSSYNSLTALTWYTALTSHRYQTYLPVIVSTHVRLTNDCADAAKACKHVCNQLLKSHAFSLPIIRDKSNVISSSLFGIVFAMLFVIKPKWSQPTLSPHLFCSTECFYRIANGEYQTNDASMIKEETIMARSKGRSSTSRRKSTSRTGQSSSRRKQGSSMMGALVVEGLAIALFVFLISQARAERDQETGLERNNSPVQELFERTPQQGHWLAMNAE